MTGTVPRTGNHGIISHRNTSTGRLQDSMTSAVRDRYRIHGLAQRRDQIPSETVTGLKEEMIFEIALKDE